MESSLKSKEERVFSEMAGEFVLSIQELGIKEVISVTYEPVRFAIPGGFYTPDFYVKGIKEDGSISLIHIEVKGSRHQRGYRTSRQRLGSAASLYPEYIFIMVLVGARKRIVTEYEIINKIPFLRISVNSVKIYDKLIGTKSVDPPHTD